MLALRGLSVTETPLEVCQLLGQGKAKYGRHEIGELELLEYLTQRLPSEPGARTKTG